MKKIIVVVILLNISFLLSSTEINDIIKNNDIYRQNLISYEAIKNSLTTTAIRSLPLRANISTKTYGSIFEPSFNYSIGADINYVLKDPDLIKELKLIEQDLLITELQLKTVYEQINYKVTTLALDYISSRNIYNHIKSSYESIFTYTKKVTDRFNSGDLSKSEKLFSDSVMLKNKASLIDAESVVESALEQLNTELGIVANKEVINLLINQIYSSDTENLKIDNKSLAILQLETNKSKLARELTKGNSSPKFSLSGSIKYPFDSLTAWQFGLNVSIPLFGIKLDESKRNEYSFEIESKTIQQTKLKNEITSEISLFNKKIINVDKKLKLYKEAREISKLSLEGILIESNAGVRTVFDVISANNSLADIERFIIESENQLLYLNLELAYLTGGLLEN